MATVSYSNIEATKALGEGGGAGRPPGLQAEHRPSLRKTQSVLLSGVPELYRHVLAHRWVQAMSRASSHPEEARYVNRADGLTALHLAVISRKKHLKSKDSKSSRSTAATHSLSHPPASAAPASAIRALLSAYPGAMSLRCSLRGYTPMAYACLLPPPSPELISGDGERELQSPEEGDGSNPSPPFKSANELLDAMLESIEEMVRLFVESSRDAAAHLTRDGLTALDVHIVSFSQNWGGDRMEAAGRTSTGVIRALLEADHSLAHPRPLVPASGLPGTAVPSPEVPSLPDGEDSPGVALGYTLGPLELLYRNNAAAFLSALATDECGADPLPRRKRLGSGKENADPSFSLASPSGLSTWWAWKWTILLLKYGSLHRKRRGSIFRAVHSAALCVGCPLPIVMLAVRNFPHQISEVDDATGGDLPLHMVASWGRRTTPAVPRQDLMPAFPILPARANNNQPRHLDPAIGSRRSMVVCALLTYYRDAALLRNAEGKTPLCLILESGAMWDSGVRRLLRSFPEAIFDIDDATGLFPFQLAACQEVVSVEEDDEHDEKGAPVGSRKAESTCQWRELNRLTTIYELLRYYPGVLEHECMGWMHCE